MSCITRHDSSTPSAGSSRTRTAPSATSRAHSASSAARRSSPTSPVPTRTSRCSRFLATFPSGTRWKYSRGPTPEGSPQANDESRSSGGCERLKSSQVANPSGGGGTTYPSTSHQKRARRSGSAQSKVTWNFLIDIIGPPYGRALPSETLQGAIGARGSRARVTVSPSSPNSPKSGCPWSAAPHSGTGLEQALAVVCADQSVRRRLVLQQRAQLSCVCGERDPAPFAFRVVAVVAEEQHLAFVVRVNGLRQLRRDDQEVDQTGAHREGRDGCQADQE